jgi:NAD(P)-dependent dehydrogenase (short-subunit alcohol dehydrogenase family)
MSKNKTNLKKIALITGGCGLLGWEYAKSLNEINYKVIILDNNLFKIKQRKHSLNKLNLDIDIYAVDITNEKNLIKKIKEIINKHKKIDVLINNAAIDFKPIKKNIKIKNNFLDFDQKRWEREISVGLTGAFLCSKVIGKYMVKKKYGIILNIASDLSIIAPNQDLYKHLRTSKPVSYSVIKHGIHGLTKYLAALWAKLNIRVNTLSPSGVLTNQDKIFIKKIKKLIPMNRMAKVNEYNEAIKYLCSDKSSYLTGQNIIIDGGRTII